MNPLYHSRQRKIYKDYNPYPSEKLLEILSNRSRYNPEILSIIEEILKERNVVIPESFRPSADIFERPKPVSETEYYEEQKKRAEKDSKLSKFIAELREKSNDEITEIITKYSYYEPEMTEAVMNVAVERGIVSYDLKEALYKQMSDNMSRHWDRKARFAWEDKNAFLDFVSRYNDDEIYEIIDNPNDIVIDVYHAVIMTALNRELISKEDFDEYFKGAKSALTTDFERQMDDFREETGLPDPDELFNDNKMKAEAENYRKCPSCGEVVEKELSVCWNCQAEVPENAEKPDLEEVRKEIISEQKGFKIHPILGMALLTLILMGGSILMDWFRHGDPFEHKYITIGFGVVLIGLFLRFIIQYNKIMKE